MKMLPSFVVAARGALLLPLLAACATTGSAAAHPPLVDYHQHLVSPAFAPIVKLPVRDGRALLAELDAAGIRKAVVLSVAYSFRQVGVSRVLYSSDLSPPGGSIRSGWEIFRERVPLTDAEFRTIAGNVTRFAR